MLHPISEIANELHSFKYFLKFSLVFSNKSQFPLIQKFQRFTKRNENKEASNFLIRTPAGFHTDTPPTPNLVNKREVSAKSVHTVEIVGFKILNNSVLSGQFNFRSSV